MNNLAYTYCEMGENLDEAVKLCNRAVELFPAWKAYFLDTLGDRLPQTRRPRRLGRLGGDDRS